MIPAWSTAWSTARPGFGGTNSSLSYPRVISQYDPGPKMDGELLNLSEASAATVLVNIAVRAWAINRSRNYFISSSRGAKPSAFGGFGTPNSLVLGTGEIPATIFLIPRSRRYLYDVDVSPLSSPPVTFVTVRPSKAERRTFLGRNTCAR